MSLGRVLNTLETDRLILRRSTVGEAAIYRQLWTERDPRVPQHRRINSEGRPTVEDIAAQIRAEREEPGPGILAVERKCTADEAGRAVVTWASEAGYRRLRAGVCRVGPDSVHGHSLLTVREP